MLDWLSPQRAMGVLGAALVVAGYFMSWTLIEEFPASGIQGPDFVAIWPKVMLVAAVVGLITLFLNNPPVGLVCSVGCLALSIFYLTEAFQIANDPLSGAVRDLETIGPAGFVAVCGAMMLTGVSLLAIKRSRTEIPKTA